MSSSPVRNLLRTVRAHFGWSQDQLAPWLGISRRLVTYAEQGQRTLPAEALRQLTRLAMLLPPAVVALPPAPPALPEPLDPAPLQARRAACHYEAEVLRREVASRTAQQATALRQLAAVAALLPVATAATPRDRLWLELRQLEATRAARASTLSVVALLQARLAALEAEAAWLTQHLPE